MPFFLHGQSLILLLTCVLWSEGVLANVKPSTVKTIWAIDHQGSVRFCYGSVVSVVYFVYDQVATKTRVVRKDIDGRVVSVGEFPGTPNERSLSCSDDGETIAAISERTVLYLSRGGRRALYKLPHYWAYAFSGVHSLLAPDGNSIILPEVPQLISGDDLLAEMKIFFVKEDASPFFVKSDVFSAKNELIIRYVQAESEWKNVGATRIPPGFDVSEIAACGSHYVASLTDDESARFLLLNDVASTQKNTSAKHDWLGKIGVRKVLKRYRSTLAIIGSFGRCSFPLYPVDSDPWLGDGFVTFDDEGLRKFLFSVPHAPLSQREIFLSKDGCFALVQLFKARSTKPEFTMPQQVQLLGLPDVRCSL